VEDEGGEAGHTGRFKGASRGTGHSSRS
jgi:hypothetical protein